MTTVSILIPVYNTEKYIAYAIESVLNQTYKDFELVIVDDHSSDQTHEICHQYACKDSRIKLFKNDENLGMMRNWNYGLSLCQGVFWGKLDADDYWAPEMIEESLKCLTTDSSIGLFTSRYICIDENNKKIDNSEYYFPDFANNKPTHLFKLVSLGPDKMFSYGMVQQGIGLMRKSFFEKHGKFTLLDSGDTEMWFRIGAHYKIFCADQLLHYHRIWEQSFTRKNVVKLNKSQKNLFEVRKHIFKYYLNSNLLDKKLYRKHIKNNYLLYNRHLTYLARINQNRFEFFSRVVKSLVLAPFSTLQFYYKRFTIKFNL